MRFEFASSAEMRRVLGSKPTRVLEDLVKQYTQQANKQLAIANEIEKILIERGVEIKQ